jgi:hypothetical protein
MKPQWPQKLRSGELETLKADVDKANERIKAIENRPVLAASFSASKLLGLKPRQLTQIVTKLNAIGIYTPQQFATAFRDQDDHDHLLNALGNALPGTTIDDSKIEEWLKQLVFRPRPKQVGS